jgi:hypothetical protein
MDKRWLVALIVLAMLAIFMASYNYYSYGVFFNPQGKGGPNIIEPIRGIDRESTLPGGSVGVPGDLNGDGIVTSEDLDLWASISEQCAGLQINNLRNSNCAEGDINGDSVLNVDDMNMMLSQTTADCGNGLIEVVYSSSNPASPYSSAPGDCDEIGGGLARSPPGNACEATGDVNYDGFVDIQDLIELLQCYGSPAVPGCEGEDVDGEGFVNVLDLIHVLLNFNTVNKNFIQICDINLFGYSLDPIGEFGDEFTGSYDGQDFSITNFNYNNPVNGFRAGLFGTVRGGTITNVALINADVTGKLYVGGLVGNLKLGGSIDNSYVTGDLVATGIETTGDAMVGGLVGWSSSSSVSNSYFTGTVNGGINGNHVGGLVGKSELGYVLDSYSISDVSGKRFVGGLVGSSSARDIEGSFAISNVIGDDDVGGLIGKINPGGSVSTSYVGNIIDTGSVSATGTRVGGLTGNNFGIIVDSYSIASVVSEGAEVGGLVGSAGGGSLVLNSYWNTITSGQESSSGGQGEDTTAMQLQITYEPEWDFEVGGTWSITDGVCYPYLQWEVGACVPA